jgi:hypothetical protein
MAARILLQEVTQHLEAAIRLSNRSLHLRILDEADRLIAINHPAAAVVVAGIVLEATFEECVPEEQRKIEKWFDLRNSVVHSHLPAVTSELAKEMVQAVRGSLTPDMQVGSRVAESQISSVALQQLRGKYKSVPTSAVEFIRRKADEVGLEHDERGL